MVFLKVIFQPTVSTRPSCIRNLTHDRPGIPFPYPAQHEDNDDGCASHVAGDHLGSDPACLANRDGPGPKLDPFRSWYVSSWPPFLFPQLDTESSFRFRFRFLPVAALEKVLDGKPTATKFAKRKHNPKNLIDPSAFGAEVASFTEALSDANLDNGHPPPFKRWQNLVRSVENKNLNQLETVLDLAKLYRDQVGSGMSSVKNAQVLTAQAIAVGYPEVALNAFLDRETYGLEFDHGALWAIQVGLFHKLTKASRAKIIDSAEVTGAPVQTVDLLAPPEADESGDGKAEVVEDAFQIDDGELARAQLSILDRMSLAAAQAPMFNQGQQDQALLSLLAAGYVHAFDLAKPANLSSPLLERVRSRTDEIIILLIQSTAGPLSVVGGNKIPLRRASQIKQDVLRILPYATDRSKLGLETVRALYKFLEKIDSATAKDE